MKISNSKKQLAKIISENGGWRDGANIALFGKASGMCYLLKTDEWPEYETSINGFYINACDVVSKFTAAPFSNWHQTILPRDEYFHLYPEAGADGWIEWKGGECPVSGNHVVDVKFRDGETDFGRADGWNWSPYGGRDDIVAYRHHNHEVTAKPERTAIEPSPTIEQLAADYRNLLDFALRKQQEADDAKSDADARLKALVLAGEALGLIVSPITAKQEPELEITDWRDLKVGDEVECVDYEDKYRFGVVISIDEHGEEQCVEVSNHNGEVSWPSKWRFIRRP